MLVAVVGLAWLGVAIRRRMRANALRDAGLRARAEYEHRLNLSGDPRGIYGRYPPVQPGWFPDPQNRSQLRYFDGAVVDRLYGLHVRAVVPAVVAVSDRRQVARRRLHQRRV